MESGREIGAPEFRDPAALAAEAQRVYDICAGLPALLQPLPVVHDPARHDRRAARRGGDAHARRGPACRRPLLLLSALLPALSLHAAASLGGRFSAADARGARDACRRRGHPAARAAARQPGAARPARVVRAGARQLGQPATASSGCSLERWLGIDRRRRLPRTSIASAAGSGARRRRPTSGATGRSRSSTPRRSSTTRPRPGRAAVRVLWRSGIDVDCPEQVCCGMPALDAGDVAGATRRARFNLEQLGRAVDEGRDVVVPGPTCSRMLKQEYPRLLPGERDRARVGARLRPGRVPDATARRRQARPELPRRARRRRLPCPLSSPRAGDRLQVARPAAAGPGDLGRGARALHGHGRHVGIQARVLRRVGEGRATRCCATSTRWRRDLIVSDCPLAALQLEQQRGQRVYHPVEALDAAYDGRTLAVALSHERDRPRGSSGTRALRRRA